MNQNIFSPFENVPDSIGRSSKRRKPDLANFSQIQSNRPDRESLRQDTKLGRAWPSSGRAPVSESNKCAQTRAPERRDGCSIMSTCPTYSNWIVGQIIQWCIMRRSGMCHCVFIPWACCDSGHAKAISAIRLIVMQSGARSNHEIIIWISV